MKKRGFGKGKWNGTGGKLEQNETPEEAAIREIKEEAGITACSLSKRAVLDFYFEDALDWQQRVHTFIVDDWHGDPVETEEMAPRWYSIGEIPYTLMWPVDEHWLPLILDGKRVRGDFLMDRSGKVLELKIDETDSLTKA